MACTHHILKSRTNHPLLYLLHWSRTCIGIQSNRRSRPWYGGVYWFYFYCSTARFATWFVRIHECVRQVGVIIRCNKLSHESTCTWVLNAQFTLPKGNQTSAHCLVIMMVSLSASIASALCVASALEEKDSRSLCRFQNLGAKRGHRWALDTTNALRGQSACVLLMAWRRMVSIAVYRRVAIVKNHQHGRPIKMIQKW